MPTSEPVVALTFDAGGNASGLGSILGTLDAEGVPGTFFLTGRWADANPDAVAAIAAAGHRFGNHSVTHPAFTTLSDAAIRDEVLGAEASIQAAGGDPRPLFRFPWATATRGRSPRSTTSATCRSAGPWTRWAGRAPAGG